MEAEKGQYTLPDGSTIEVRKKYGGREGTIYKYYILKWITW